MFNAMWTQDVRQVVKLLRKKFPKRPLLGMGFSLGANILASKYQNLVKNSYKLSSNRIIDYMGEESESCPLQAAVLISSPHNLDACGKIMNMSWTGRQYSKFMATNLKKLLERNIEMMSTNPNINLEEVRATTYLAEYDHYCTARVYGFRTGGEYYRASGSVDKLLNVRVPTLIINAEDDPIALKQAFPKWETQANEYLCFVTTSTGGHIGWFEAWGERWFPKPIMGFLDKMGGLEVVQA